LKKIVSFFFGFFLLVQFFGLYIGNEYITLLKTDPDVKPIFPNPERPENSIFLFLYILLTTGLIILVIKYKRSLLRVIEVVAVFSATLVTFDFLFPSEIFYLSFLLAVVLNAWRILRPNPVIQNLVIALSIPSIGALIGASLGILPSLIFIVLLSVYDFVSVFITKHMVHIAKEVTKFPSAFALSLPHKFKKPVVFKVGKEKIKKKIHTFHLGSGDMVIPLMFAVSVLAAYSLANALLTVVGSAVAFFSMLYFFTKKPQALPAIPLISSGTLAGFLISLLIV